MVNSVEKGLFTGPNKALVSFLVTCSIRMYSIISNGNKAFSEVINAGSNITLRVGSKGVGDDVLSLTLIILSIMPIIIDDIAQFSLNDTLAEGNISYHKYYRFSLA